jgi:hypothetical protein
VSNTAPYTLTGTPVLVATVPRGDGVEIENTGANPAYIGGGPNVTAANGRELTAITGSTPTFQESLSSEDHEWWAMSPTGTTIVVTQPYSLTGPTGEQGPQGATGPSTPGALAMHTAPFAYNTAGILTGATLVFDDGWTPSVDEQLVNLYVRVLTAWDGTSPLCDVGPFAAGDAGAGYYKGMIGEALELVYPDNQNEYAHCSNLIHGGTLDAMDLANLVIQESGPGGAILTVSGANLAVATPFMPSAVRALPATFANTDPLKVVVSQDGTTSGADPASTQGSAVACFITAKPA